MVRTTSGMRRTQSLTYEWFPSRIPPAAASAPDILRSVVPLQADQRSQAMAIAPRISDAVVHGNQETRPWTFGIRSGAGENCGIWAIFKYSRGQLRPSIRKHIPINATVLRAPAAST